MAMALHAAAQHRPLQHVERGKQGCGPVPLIVGGHGRWSARLHGRAGSGAAERVATRTKVLHAALVGFRASLGLAKPNARARVRQLAW